jgi:hypothetical protein
VFFFLVSNCNPRVKETASMKQAFFTAMRTCTMHAFSNLERRGFYSDVRTMMAALRPPQTLEWAVAGRPAGGQFSLPTPISPSARFSSLWRPPRRLLSCDQINPIVTLTVRFSPGDLLRFLVVSESKKPFPYPYTPPGSQLDRLKRPRIRRLIPTRILCPSGRVNRNIYRRRRRHEFAACQFL